MFLSTTFAESNQSSFSSTDSPKEYQNQVFALAVTANALIRSNNPNYPEGAEKRIQDVINSGYTPLLTNSEVYYDSYGNIHRYYINSKLLYVTLPYYQIIIDYNIVNNSSDITSCSVGIAFDSRDVVYFPANNYCQKEGS